MANDLARAILNIGQGAVFLQLDGVKTRRGDVEPVLVTWIDGDTWCRQTAVLGVGYDTGKGAKNSARNVRQCVTDIKLLGAVQELVRQEYGAARHHYQAWVKPAVEKFKASGTDDDAAAVTALVSYMFGSATADGAIKGLLKEVVDLDEPLLSGDDYNSDDVDSAASAALASPLAASAASNADDQSDGDEVNSGRDGLGMVDEGDGDEGDGDEGDEGDGDETTTHHCSAHRMSLVARFAFALKSHKGIYADPQGRAILVHLNGLIDNVRRHFANDRAFNTLQEFAQSKGLPPLLRMNKPTPTRFTSYADLIWALKCNMEIFSALISDQDSEAPSAVMELFAQHEVSFVDDNGANQHVKYRPNLQIGHLSLVTRALTHLIMVAETDDADAFHFQLMISTLMAQMAGRVELEVQLRDKATSKLPTSLFLPPDVGTGAARSPLLPGLGRTVNAALAFYFDRPLATDWAELLCLALHPFCSGLPAAAAKDVASSWPCLYDRFQHLMTKKEDGHWERMTETEAQNHVRAVMAAAEKILMEELETQYDIDHAQPVPVKAHDSGRSGNKDDDGEPTSKKQMTSNTAFRLMWERLAKRQPATDSIAAPVTKSKQETVQEQFANWTRKRATCDTAAPTLLGYWQSQRDNPLRRLALRAGGFMLSQCATERINKVVKEVWTAKRARLLARSMRKQVFLHSNMERISCWPRLAPYYKTSEE